MHWSTVKAHLTEGQKCFSSQVLASSGRDSAWLFWVSLLCMTTDDRPLTEEVPSEVKVSATLRRGMSSCGHALLVGLEKGKPSDEHSCRPLTCSPDTSDIPLSQRLEGLWSSLSARSLNDRYRDMSRHG